MKIKWIFHWCYNLYVILYIITVAFQMRLYFHMSANAENDF